MIYRPGKDQALKLMPPKDPDSISKPYRVVLSGRSSETEIATYLAEGILITNATATTSDPLLVVDHVEWESLPGYTDTTNPLNPVQVPAFNAVTVWLSAGTVGTVATISVHFVTNQNNGVGGFYEDEVSFYLPIRQR